MMRATTSESKLRNQILNYKILLEQNHYCAITYPISIQLHLSVQLRRLWINRFKSFRICCGTVYVNLGAWIWVKEIGILDDSFWRSVRLPSGAGCWEYLKVGPNRPGITTGPIYSGWPVKITASSGSVATAARIPLRRISTNWPLRDFGTSTASTTQRSARRPARPG